MSFDVNSIGPRKQPTILEAQNMQNNGGGGNLGYFFSERKRKGNEFDEDENTDCFIREDDEFLARKGALSFWQKLRKLFFGK